MLLLGAAAGWSLQRFIAPAAATEAEGDEHGPKGADLAAAVKLGHATAGAADVLLRLLGRARFDANAEWTFAPTTSNRVAAVAVAPGQVVAAGELLLRFDAAPVAAAMAAASADLAAARAEYGAFDGGGRAAREAELAAAQAGARRAAELAQQRSEHLAALRGDGLTAARTLQEARAEADRLQAAAQQAEAQLQQWQQREADQQSRRLLAAIATAEEHATTARTLGGDVEVRAPAPGRVTAVAVHTGDLPAPGTVLVRLAISDARRVEVAIAPQDLPRAPTGTPVIVHDGDAALQGKVAGAAPAVDAASGLALLLVRLEPGQAHVPLDGAAVAADVVVQHLDSAVLVPPAAVVRHDDATAVVKVDAGGIAHVTPVRIVGRSGELLAVEGELAAGDAIVVDGAVNLPDGAHVAADGAGAGDHR